MLRLLLDHGESVVLEALLGLLARRLPLYLFALIEGPLRLGLGRWLQVLALGILSFIVSGCRSALLLVLQLLNSVLLLFSARLPEVVGLLFEPFVELLQTALVL